jgi:large subunit ribosomal protein L3
MVTIRRPRNSSLQFWPRKRANKFIPSVNWTAVNDSSKPLKGFIVYKAGMASAEILDNTNNSLTKGKKRIIPVTILECPPAKILSVRFYKFGKVATEIINDKLDKELIRVLRIPKKASKKIEDVNVGDYEDIRLTIYSIPKKTNIKKSPDITEIAVSGSVQDKLNFIKENWHKEFSVSQFFEKGQLVDVRGVTKGKGFQGTIKRYGIKLKNHKTEKGQRRPGTLGPWHPAHVSFRTPQAGQMGNYTRIIYNNKILGIGKVEDFKSDKLKNIKNYGDVKAEYIIVKGSVQGPAKRQLLITSPLRPTKEQGKLDYTLEGLY